MTATGQLKTGGGGGGEYVYKTHREAGGAAARCKEKGKSAKGLGGMAKAKAF